MNLFIIGNGFDLSHGLPTSYHDFLGYLEEKNKTEFVYSLEQISGFERSILWSNFEENLGDITPDLYTESALQQRRDMYDSLEYPADAEDTINYHIDNEVLNDLDALYDVTSEWINSVEFEDSIKEVAIDEGKIYSDIIDNESFFINFNYTGVLEEVYNIFSENIFHIHGDTNEPVIGHDTILEDKVLYGNDMYSEDIIFENRIYDKIKDFVNDSNKNIVKNIEKLKQKIEWLDIDEIIVIGLSFGKVDKQYFEFIHSEFDNVNWKFSYFGQTPEKEDIDKNSKISFLRSIGVNESKIIPLSGI